MIPTSLSELSPVALWGNQHTVGAGHGLTENGRHGARSLQPHDVVELPRTLPVAALHLLAEWAAITVTVEGVQSPRKQRLQWRATIIPGQGESPRAGSVIGTIASDQFVSTGHQP